MVDLQRRQVDLFHRLAGAIEHFLEPSFTTSAAAGEHAATAEAGQEAAAAEAEHAAGEEGASHTAVELALMGFSVLIAAIGIGLAWKFYVISPEISERLAAQFSGAHRTLLNKYYVDEFYGATFIAGTFASARSLFTFDRRVVDGAVNGSSWLTLFSAWVSGLTDRTIVDGAVNLVGAVTQEASYWFRRVQTGLVQNYALLMLFGVFAFVSLYLFVK